SRRQAWDRLGTSSRPEKPRARFASAVPAATWPACVAPDVAIGLLPCRITDREIEQVPRDAFCLVRRFRRGDPDDQAIGRLPVNPVATCADELVMVPSVGSLQLFQEPCHFVCLFVVTCCGARQQQARSLLGSRLFNSRDGTSIRPLLSRKPRCPRLVRPRRRSRATACCRRPRRWDCRCRTTPACPQSGARGGAVASHARWWWFDWLRPWFPHSFPSHRVCPMHTRNETPALSRLAENSEGS